VDTCAAEFEAYTPYYYSTYETEMKRGPPPKEKSRLSAAAQTASARALNLTTAVSMPRLRSPKKVSRAS
jgi:hypothetical protein